HRQGDRRAHHRVPPEERRLQEDRGADERARHRREELPQAQTAHHGLDAASGAGRTGLTVTVRERAPAIAGRTSSVGRADGYTLVEVMFVAGVIAVIVATAVPQIGVGIERARARGAARYLAGQMIF